MSDARILTAKEREHHLGEIRRALGGAFKLIEDAGADAVLIVAIHEQPDKPGVPAVVCQARRTDECSLTADNVVYLALRSMQVSLGGEVDPPDQSPTPDAPEGE